MPANPLYFDANGNPTNRAPRGFEFGWTLNIPGSTPFTPPGTAKR